MPTDSHTHGRHRPPTPHRLRRERRHGAQRALLAAFAAPAPPALWWWLGPYAARVAASRTRKP